MDQTKAPWRLTNLLRFALTAQLCLSLLVVHSPVAQARRVVMPMPDPIHGEKGSLYKINRGGEIIFGSEEMKLSELKPDERNRLFHLAHSSEDENLKSLAQDLAKQEAEIRRNEGGCGMISGWFGCDEAQKAAKLEEATRQADLKLNALNQAAKAFYGEHQDYVDDLKQFPTYQFMGINDTFSRGDEEEEAKLPPYCQNYPSVGTESYKDYMGESSNDDVIYSTCIDESTPFVLTVGNLVDNYLEVERFNYKKGQELLERELANESIKKIIATRSAYTAINPGMKDGKDDVTLSKLNTCVAENASDESSSQSSKEVQQVLSSSVSEQNQQAESGEDLAREYTTSNVKNAIISAALFQMRDESKAWAEDENLKLENRFMETCVNDLAVYQQDAESEELKFCRNYSAHQDEIEKQAAIAESKSMAPIALLYKSDPTLFTAVNDKSLFDWFNYQPAPSDLSQKLTSIGKSGELVNGVKEAISSDPENPLKAAETFLLSQRDNFAAVVDEASAEPTIQALSQEKTKEHIRGLTESALKLCEGDIEHLHHFPDLYAKAMDNMAKSGDPNAGEKIMQMQGAYCYMLRKDPPNQETGFTLMQGLGIGLAVLGTAAQFVPALGTAVGTGMILAGGALTMTDAAIKLDRRMGELATQNAMLAAGWTDYKSKLDAHSKAWDAGTDMALEFAFFAVDVATVPKIAGALRRSGTRTGAELAGAGDEVVETALESVPAVRVQSSDVARLAPNQLDEAASTAPAIIDEVAPLRATDNLPAVRGQSTDLAVVRPSAENLPAVRRGSENLPALRPSAADEAPIVETRNLPVVRAQSTDVAVIKPVDATDADIVRPSAENLPAVRRSENLPALRPSAADEAPIVETRNLPVVRAQSTDVAVIKPVDATDADIVRPTAENLPAVRRTENLPALRPSAADEAPIVETRNLPAVRAQSTDVAVIKPVDATDADIVRPSAENLPAVRRSENLPALPPSAADEAPIVETRNLPALRAQSTDVAVIKPVDATDMDIIRPAPVDEVRRAERPALAPPEEVRALPRPAVAEEAASELTLTAHADAPSTALVPIDRAKRADSVTTPRRVEPVNPVNQDEVLRLPAPAAGSGDEAVDALASVRRDIARRPATSARFDFAASLSRNSEALVDDFMQALSDVPSSTRSRLLEHIDKGHFAPEELSKLMDEAVSSFKKACQ